MQVRVTDDPYLSLGGPVRRNVSKLWPKNCGKIGVNTPVGGVKIIQIGRELEESVNARQVEIRGVELNVYLRSPRSRPHHHVLLPWEGIREHPCGGVRKEES